MLLKILRFLNLDITGRTWEELAEHEYFGEIVYWGNKNKEKCYWECKLDVDGEEIFIGIDSPDGNLPSEAHVEFVRLVTSNLEPWFSSVATAIVPDFEKRFARKFSSNWRDQLIFGGMELPYNLSDGFSWYLMFETSKEPNSTNYTCHMKGDKMTGVTIE